MADWSELPVDVIGLFADRLPFLEDFISFASVCKSWRSAAVDAKTRRKPLEPWLVLAKHANDNISGEEGAAIRGFFSLRSNQLFHSSMPELQGRRCWGTRCGWIITLGLDSEFHLFNPLTKARFSLPPKTTLPPPRSECTDKENMCRSFAGSFALSSNPSISGESVVVMATYGERHELAFASPKDKSWTHVQGAFSANDDVIFFNEQFYSISVEGTLRVSDTNSTEPVSIDIAPPPPTCDMCAADAYLADILGDLHMIVRSYKSAEAEFYEDMHVYTTHFSIYKFDFHTTQWIQVKGFEAHSLFVGNNTTFAVLASNYPEFQLKPNCIYFTDDHTEYYDNEFCDMGIYDMEKEVVVEHFCKEMGLLSNFSRPFFLMSTKVD